MLGKDIPRTRGQVSATVLTYDQALAEVEVGIDDDAGPQLFQTLSKRTLFLCDWDPVSQMIEFRFGEGNRKRVLVEEALLHQCLVHFHRLGWFPIASAHADCDQRTPGSLGRWLCEIGNVTVNIASYFAAFLVDQGLAEYRRPGQTGGELQIL